MVVDLRTNKSNTRVPSYKMTGMNLNTSLLKAVSQFPDRVAVSDGMKRLTYEELGKRVGALVEVFDSLGLAAGDVVACLAPNCQEYLELYYGCAFARTVLNPLNFRLGPLEISSILKDSSARVLVAHSDFKELALAALADLDDPDLVVLWLGSIQKPEPKKAYKYEPTLLSKWGAELPDTQASPDDLAQLYYTSGTTGNAKGVMLSHRNVATNAAAAIAELSLDDSETWAHIAPMFHLVDAWAVWAITWIGGKHTFMSYFKPEEALKLFETESVTRTALVPTMLSAMLSSPSAWEYSYNSLRAIMTAGSPVAPDLVRQVNEIFRCDFVQFYGMTETSPFLTVSVPYARDLNKPGHVTQEIRAKTGRPLYFCEVKVVRENGQQVARDNLEVGEIIARGPNVTAGYWKQPEITARTIIDGWIHTGDLAVIDESGYINIVDRKKDMIITGGENVYSTEVEHVLYDHPSVYECAVIGVPDDKWGEAIKAWIVLHKNVSTTEDDLIAFVKERLAHYKAPRIIEFVDELPKTGSGKIYKKQLRDLSWQGYEKKVH